MPYALDDAAAAALWTLAQEKREHMGALYSDKGGIARSNTITANDDSKVRGTLSVPKGSLLGLFHNHPTIPGEEDLQEQFSRTDRQRAALLGVPSYILAGNKVLSYDPSTKRTEEVLAQIPLEEIRRLYLSEGLKK